MTDSLSRFAPARIGLALAFGSLLVTAVRVSGQSPTLPPLNPGQPPAAASATPIDVAGRLIADAQASFARVRDYSGLFYKQERVGGQLLPEQTIQIRVRQQ